MRWIQGDTLNSIVQRHALSKFVHRFTKDHRPAWANESRPGGKPYRVQFASDSDWLQHTRFAVTQAGQLDKRARWCRSTPTWPEEM